MCTMTSTMNCALRDLTMIANDIHMQIKENMELGAERTGQRTLAGDSYVEANPACPQAQVLMFERTMGAQSE